MSDNLALNPLEEQAIRRVVDLLFIYTDQKEWLAARQLFIDGPIPVDMTSLAGGKPVQMTADDLFGGFSVGLHARKLSHHMATNYLITINGNRAEVLAHGYAWNLLLDSHELWETWGVYYLPLQHTEKGWKLSGFRYDAKHNRGNDSVRTHTLS